MLLTLLQTMRPHQWTKNIFIFVALVFDGKLFDVSSFINTSFGFVMLCLISGIGYIINDLVDVEKDRLHPTKKFRPIASGALKERVALVGIIILLLITIPLSLWLSFGFGLLIIAYLGLQLVYTFYLKNLVIIDVLTIATLFVMRVAAGVLLIEVTRFSPWLYVFTTMLALFLGVGKRRQELVLMKQDLGKTRTILKEYSIPFVDEMITIVTASTIMTYALYTFSAPNLPKNNSMMLTIPFIIYGIFRYLYLIHIKGSSGDPSEVVLDDRPLQITVLLFGITVVLVLYYL